MGFLRGKESGARERKIKNINYDLRKGKDLTREWTQAGSIKLNCSFTGKWLFLPKSELETTSSSQEKTLKR